MDRRAKVLEEMRARLDRKTHIVFLWLAFVRWIFTFLLFGVSEHRRLDTVLLGVCIDGVTLAIVRMQPSMPLTRYVVAISQSVWPVIWTSFTVGRADAHYYAFALLAVLAFYRDWRILAVAVSLFSLELVFLSVGSLWTGVGWLVFEALVLMLGCVQAAREMDDAAGREAMLQQTALTVQQKVENRTRAQQARTERYRALVENTEAMPFEYDGLNDQVLYIAPKAVRVFDVSSQELREPGFFARRIHPEDRDRILEATALFLQGKRSPSEPLDYRMCTLDRTVHIRTFFSSFEQARIRGVSLDVTRQAILEGELRQAQKLESVGRLAAGIAHEINTPVQYVSDSLEFTRSVIPDLLTVIAAQSEAIDHPTDESIVKWARELVTTSDVAYLAEELPRAVERAVEGMDRISVIVKSMRVFARLDSTAMSDCDLKLAIESTLAISRTEYKDVADVALVFEDLPKVRCRAGEINQVILNLVVNAGHAIAEVVSNGERGLITVELRQVGDDAVISVRDTGGGIPPAIHDRVFDQFFTTKVVGKGTGQGLALSRVIVVDNHHGALTFDTSPSGTTFHVRIPLQAVRLSSAA